MNIPYWFCYNIQTSELRYDETGGGIVAQPLCEWAKINALTYKVKEPWNMKRDTNTFNVMLIQYFWTMSHERAESSLCNSWISGKYKTMNEWNEMKWN
jgi:hypothetical protein